MTVHKRRGAYLPHWTKPGGIYSVTFRLADTLPQRKLQEWRREHEDILQTAQYVGRTLSFTERMRLQKLHESLDVHLDAGYGACFLRRADIAELVTEALRYFDGDRYRLFAWCVMPNHVHVVLQLREAWMLSHILHSWKSFTAKKANTILGRTGAFWQAEYYDHLVRDEEDLLRCVEYVWYNPDDAGLCEWRWRWRAKGL